MKPSGFIEVHALCDGKVASIRADVIDAVFDNDEMDIDGAHKPACRRFLSVVAEASMSRRVMKR